MRAEPGLSKRVSLERLRRLGLRPATIFDVGVATGTPELYGVFPDAKYALIEPLTESWPFMQKVLDSHPGSVAVQAAAGRASGEGRLVVSPNLSGSSFILSPKSGEARAVPIVTIDEVVLAHALPGPYLLKLDVQGYELEALAGAEATLGQTCAIIAEVSLWGDKKRAGMAELLPLMSWLRERGFVLYDIAQIVRRELDDAITEMDLVFCPSDSPLRRNTSYKSGQQAEAVTEKRRRAFGLS